MNNLIYNVTTMQALPFLMASLALAFVVTTLSNTAHAQRHHKKIMIGRRAGHEELPLYSDDSHANSFTLYDIDGDGFLSQREFYTLPLCRDPPPCDLTLLAEEIKDEIKTNQDAWRR
ncbi:uncharacterized protein LOC100894044 [Strongylocentrotus purpuratus]|uniref:EF-hand domain-containing protein n=1 Tax=Strongylocentrotus purpuratus TaxID=7668 RepID=A0A7M7GIW4_STRPU|nr:uncharacterized protein LOC100894044 [Strongylocentrotus purpuratus]|eukprot:XP_003730497.1 PREDICTED: uncharacterized protein LOC100894044 [Strongylocentrotus purpuratus]